MHNKNLFTKTLINLCLSSALVACGSSSDNSSEPEPISDVNSITIAHAGNNQVVKINELLSISVEQSSDPDGDFLTYLWSFKATPAGSSSQLLNTTNETTSFTADTIGSYILSLVVNDGVNDSVEASVTITVSDQETSLIDITDIKLTSQDGSCSDYIGEYVSNVSDIKRNMAFNCSISIKMDGDTCTLVVNEIPNHDFNDETASFATNVSIQTGSYEIDSAPEMADTVTDITLGTRNGVFLNGVMVDLLAAACYAIGNEALGREKIGCGPDQITNPWRYDPMSSLNGPCK